VKLAYDAFKPSAVSYLSSRPPLIIIHGLCGGKRNWQAIAKAICRAGQQVGMNYVLWFNNVSFCCSSNREVGQTPAYSANWRDDQVNFTQVVAQRWLPIIVLTVLSVSVM